MALGGGGSSLGVSDPVWRPKVFLRCRAPSNKPTDLDRRRGLGGGGFVAGECMRDGACAEATDPATMASASALTVMLGRESRAGAGDGEW